MIKYKYGNTDASIVLVQMVDDHDLSVIENEAAKIRELSGQDFCLIALKVDDWNRDLSPWEAPAAFGDAVFDGCARDTLERVLQIQEMKDEGKKFYIGGYSLAGLFALWAAYQTDMFAGAAAASPSIWYPGFTDFMKTHHIRTNVVYLSLGDREEKTRNPVMSKVGDCIRAGYSLLQDENVRCTLEWNKGNHFKEPDLRTAKAFAWVIQEGRMG